jgi:hypothetical protein
VVLYILTRKLWYTNARGSHDTTSVHGSPFSPRVSSHLQRKQLEGATSKCAEKEIQVEEWELGRRKKKRTTRRWICGSAGARRIRRRRRPPAERERRAQGGAATRRTPAAAPPRSPSTASRRASRRRPAAASHSAPPHGPPCPTPRHARAFVPLAVSPLLSPSGGSSCLSSCV